MQTRPDVVTARDKVLAWLDSVDQVTQGTDSERADSDVIWDMLKSTSKVPSSADGDRKSATPPRRRGKQRRANDAVVSLHEGSRHIPAAKQALHPPPQVYEADGGVYHLVVGLAGEPPHPGGPIRHAYISPETPQSGRSRHKWSWRSRTKCDTCELLPSDSDFLNSSSGKFQYPAPYPSPSDAVLRTTTSPHPSGPMRHNWRARHAADPASGHQRHRWTVVKQDRPVILDAQQWPTSWRQPHDMPAGQLLSPVRAAAAH